MEHTQRNNFKKAIDIFRLNFSVSRFFGLAPFKFNSSKIQPHKILYKYSFVFCFLNTIAQFSWFFYNCSLVPPQLNFIFASTEMFMIIFDSTCTPFIILVNSENICKTINWISQFDWKNKILQNKFPFLYDFHVLILYIGCLLCIALSFIGAVRTSEVFLWGLGFVLLHLYMLLLRFVMSFLLFHQFYIQISMIGFCYNSLNREIFSVLEESRSLKMNKQRLMKKFEMYKKIDGDLKKMIESVCFIYSGNISVLIFILFFGYIDAFGVRLRFKMFNVYTHLRLIFMTLRFLAIVIASDYSAKQVLILKNFFFRWVKKIK